MKLPKDILNVVKKLYYFNILNIEIINDNHIFYPAINDNNFIIKEKINMDDNIITRIMGLKLTENEIDTNSILLEYTENIMNMKNNETLLEINEKEDDTKIREKIIKNIHNIIYNNKKYLNNKNFYIMTNYKMICFLKNNIENNIRKFEDDGDYYYIVNEHLNDCIIIGNKYDPEEWEKRNVSRFIINAKDLNSKLFFIKNANKYFHKIKLNRINDMYPKYTVNLDYNDTYSTITDTTLNNNNDLNPFSEDRII